MMLPGTLNILVAQHGRDRICQLLGGTEDWSGQYYLVPRHSDDDPGPWDLPASIPQQD